tara:strand:+ start:86178 stop:87077 length:900 start_codon:yes stop_codon:yes gene_type:complete
MLTWEDIKNSVSKEVYETIHDDLIDKEHQTQFYTFTGGFTFILRSLTLKGEDLAYRSEYFVFLNKQILSYDFETQHFKVFTESLDYFLDAVYERFESNKSIFLLYNGEVDKMEDSLYDRKIPASFMDNWFDLKKDISKIERFFSRQIFAYSDLTKFGDKVDEFPSLDFKNMIADIQFVLSSANGTIARLDNLHNYYLSLKNDKLNKNIYALTILSGIFLPLNLIVGFFGMNTEGLFFKENPHGTIYVVYILASILFLFLIGFQLLKLVDRFLLRWLLGRSSIYRRLANKITDIEESWKF